MKCPNYLICNGNEIRSNGVCYECDNELYSFFNKERELLDHCRYPSVEPEPKTWYENSTKQLNKCVRDNLLSKLYNNRLTTGILNIEEISELCPICLENKHIFVKHPTCNLHILCDSCFKETFFDKTVLYPEEPKCYNIFRDFLDENGIQDVSDKYSNNQDQEGYYNCYFDSPKDDWPLNIKEIYSICSEYDRNWYDCNEKEEKIEEENTNLRQCPICRESKLHI